jgi:hypothetical protein
MMKKQLTLTLTKKKNLKGAQDLYCRLRAITMDLKSDFILDLLISCFAFHYGFIFSSATSLLSLFF